jgi:hypothetical protein
MYGFNCFCGILHVIERKRSRREKVMEEGRRREETEKRKGL